MSSFRRGGRHKEEEEEETLVEDGGRGGEAGEEKWDGEWLRSRTSGMAGNENVLLLRYIKPGKKKTAKKLFLAG